jgi:hypothetical protein
MATNTPTTTATSTTTEPSRDSTPHPQDLDILSTLPDLLDDEHGSVTSDDSDRSVASDDELRSVAGDCCDDRQIVVCEDVCEAEGLQEAIDEDGCLCYLVVVDGGETELLDRLRRRTVRFNDAPVMVCVR